ncbi:MAG: LamG-like jellyroll fold domain-containing protein, partial [Pseudomonadota bacterium]
GDGVADRVENVFQGEIHQIELYDQPLAADQIQTLADDGLAAAAEPAPAPAPDPAPEPEPETSDGGPLLHYRGFGAPGETVDNEAGEAHDGVVQDDGWTLVEDSSDFDLDAGTFALSWEAPADAAPYALFSRDSHGLDDGGHFLVLVDDGQVKIRLQSDSSEVWLGAPIDEGAENTVAVRFGDDGETAGLTLFVNGEAVNSSAFSGGIGGNDEPLVIGARDWQSGDGVADKVDQVFDGEITGLMLWEERLDDAAVAALDPSAPGAWTQTPEPAPEPDPAPPPADPEPLLSFTAFGAPGETVDNEAGDDHDGVVQDDGWTLVEDASAFDIDAGALSVVFNADDVNANQGLFSRDSNGYDEGGHLSVWIENGEIVVRLQSDDGNTYLRAPVEAGETTSAVIAFGQGAEGETDGVKLFLNGELADSDAYSGGIGGNDEPLVIGATQRRSGDGVADRVENVFQGEIHQIELYDQPLAADQIQTLADDGLASAPGQTLSGGDSDDSLVGGAHADTLDGGGLNDTLAGEGGHDSLEGGGGDDTIYGGDGNDRLTDESGFDSFYGGAGDDTIDAARGDDAAFGGAGDDTLYGGEGRDVMHGGDGDDALYGGEGQSDMKGDAGDDLMVGGGDEDWMQGGDDADTLQGAGGRDTLFGGDGDDRLEGGDDADSLYGGEGEDALYGGGGDDVFSGFEGGGDDDVFGGADTDALDLTDASEEGRPWTLQLDDEDAVLSDDGAIIQLSDEAGGEIIFEDGETINFDGIEQIHY